jgi:hypothetical protein
MGNDVRCSMQCYAHQYLNNAPFIRSTLEIFTDLPPFGYINGVDIIYHLVVRENQRPDRPEPELGTQRGLTDDIWFLITKSWEKDPQLRPTFKQLTQLIPESRSAEPEIDDLQGE